MNEHYKKNRHVVKASSQDKTITVDPYYVSKYCDVMDLGAPAFHMLKKLMRGRAKGHTEEQVLSELQSCLDRWKELAEVDCICGEGLICLDCVEKELEENKCTFDDDLEAILQDAYEE